MQLSVASRKASEYKRPIPYKKQYRGKSHPSYAPSLPSSDFSLLFDTFSTDMFPNFLSASARLVI